MNGWITWHLMTSIMNPDDATCTSFQKRHTCICKCMFSRQLTFSRTTVIGHCRGRNVNSSNSVPHGTCAPQRGWAVMAQWHVWLRDPFFAMNNGSTSCNHCFSPPMCLRTKPRIRRLTKDSIRKQLHLYSFCVYWISYIRHVLVNLIIRYNVVLLCNTLQDNVMML